MIVCVWLNQSADPHYGGHRPADVAELSVLPTVTARGLPATVLTDCLPAGHRDGVEFVHVDPLGGNPYFDRWRHLNGWLHDAGSHHGFVWATDANDVLLLNDPYPDWLDDSTLYVGSEPVDGPDARSVGFWWMRQLHPDHADWIDAHADLPLLNAGLIGASGDVLREFTDDLLDVFDGCGDVTEMAAVNRVLYERWTDRFVTGDRVHTPMWSFETEHPHSIFAHK